MLPSDICDLGPTAMPGDERRSSPRASCHWAAIVRLNDGTSCDAVVVDASKGGMRVVCEAAVDRGDRVSVELRNIGNYACEVRWRAQGRFGVRFENSPGELSSFEADAIAECIVPDLPLALLD
ncbi:MAG: PilZ domain-containing protein [Alphaproteobacteria bacterium]|nr:PilZ domain-containing protein [Alphaproteobacteria bacterium]